MTPISLKPSHLIINNTNGYIEESNGNRYLILVLTDESREIKKYEKMWGKI